MRDHFSSRAVRARHRQQRQPARPSRRTVNPLDAASVAVDRRAGRKIKGLTKTTMLTHARRPLGRSARSSDVRPHARTRGAAHLGATKRFFAGLLVVLAAAGAAACVIALKTAYHLSY